MRASSAAQWAAALCLAPAVFAAGQAQLPEGPGKKTVEAACAVCHGLDVVTAKKWSREQWQDSVKDMAGRGASLTKEETSDVVDYLARNFGKKDRARELFEDVCSYCHSLQKVKGQELTRDEWRDLIKGMIFEGAPVTEEEFALIVEYLAKNFGTKEP